MPRLDAFHAPKTGNIIAIYTYAGKGIFRVSRTMGILKTAVPVFSASREFYEPKYKTLKPEDWFKPDLRALVHWEPKCTVDSLGKASTTFYNADNTGKMQVVVEAISEKGEIGYQEMEYDKGEDWLPGGTMRWSRVTSTSLACHGKPEFSACCGITIS